MKKVLLFFGWMLLIASIANAQVPQGIPYQAIARNGQGQPLANANVKVRFSILDSTATGTAVYVESHNTTTSALGLFTANVGMGTASIGTFSAINWGQNYKFLKVELDTTATGNSYIDLGTQQMMSVPYALYAESSSSNKNIKSDNLGNFLPDEVLNINGSYTYNGLNSGAPMNPVIVPNGKTYNIKFVNISQFGACHGSGINVNGVRIWSNNFAGSVDVWLKPGDTLSFDYGNWAGCNGSMTDNWVISICVYNLNITDVVTITGSYTYNGSSSGSPMGNIVVPANKIYNIKYISINKSGACHGSGLFINGNKAWSSNYNSNVDVWLQPGDSLTFSYGEWAGCNGSMTDNWFISIHSIEKN